MHSFSIDLRQCDATWDRKGKFFKSYSIDRENISTSNVHIKEEDPVDYVLVLPESEDDQQNLTQINKNSKIKRELNYKTSSKNKHKRNLSRHVSSVSDRICSRRLNCKQSFKCDRSLEKHIKEEHGDTYECKDCSKIYKNAQAFYSHKRNVHGDLKCIQCGQRFSLKMGLIKHNMLIKCPSCTDTFTCVRVLRRHKNRLHNSSWYPCKQCTYVGKSMHYLVVHQTTHTKPFSCETCNERFASSTSLKTHEIMKRHGQFLLKTPEKTFTCDKCGEVFLNRQGIRQHLKGVHKTDNIFFHCDYCLKVFKQKSSLIRHIFSHVALLTCKICNQKRNKFTMHQHYEMVHINQPRYQCDLCSRKFKYKDNIENHMKRAHKNGEYYCCLCTQKYQTIKEIIDHQRIHTGIRQWKCMHCDHITTRLFNLTKHIEAIHEKKKNVRKVKSKTEKRHKNLVVQER